MKSISHHITSSCSFLVCDACHVSGHFGPVSPSTRRHDGARFWWRWNRARCFMAFAWVLSWRHLRVQTDSFKVWKKYIENAEWHILSCSIIFFKLLRLTIPRQVTFSGAPLTYHCFESSTLEMKSCICCVFGLGHVWGRWCSGAKRTDRAASVALLHWDWIEGHERSWGALPVMTCHDTLWIVMFS